MVDVEELKKVFEFEFLGEFFLLDWGEVVIGDEVDEEVFLFDFFLLFLFVYRLQLIVLLLIINYFILFHFMDI
jgi:hypothetical protein